MKFKTVIAFGLASLLTLTPALAGSVYADTTSDLDELNASIDDLEQQKQDLLGSIDDLKQKLVTTISQLDSVNADLVELQSEMEQTNQDLASAEAEEDKEYDAMKARIQYFYESGGEDGGLGVALLSRSNVSDILNNIEYTQQIYNYDRQQLQDYIDVVQQVNDLKQEQQDQNAQLVSTKNSLTEGQTTLESLMSEAEQKYDNADAELQDARELAQKYQQLIDEENQKITAQQAAQAAAQGTEETAAQQTAAQNTTYAAAAVGSGVTSTTAGTNYGTTAAGTAGNASSNTAYTSNTANTTASTGTGTSSSASSSGKVSGNASSSLGQAIVDYASQYVGGKYVYGGNDLSSGVDCSGFVQQVYKNFGISTSRTSYDIENDGTSVSYSDVQVGDVICYDGHVGIYAGNGQILNAIDDEHGIGYSNANYSEIRSIRRYS